MKRITIIGDSYSCGEWMAKNSPGYDLNSLYRKEIDNHDCLYVETHPGIESYLNDMGHACCTFGFGGSSNLCQLSILEESLMLRPRSRARFSSPHVIVWFVTEPLRDLINVMDDIDFISRDKEEILAAMNGSGSLYEFNLRVLDITFRRANHIFECVSVPFILVQGMSGSYGLEKNYDFCMHNFDTWSEDIVGRKPPVMSSMQTLISIKDKMISLFGYDEMNALMDEIREWQNYAKKCEYMPDGGHPDRRKHFELAVEIDKIISR